MLKPEDAAPNLRTIDPTLHHKFTKPAHMTEDEVRSMEAEKTWLSMDGGSSSPSLPIGWGARQATALTASTAPVTGDADHDHSAPGHAHGPGASAGSGSGPVQLEFGSMSNISPEARAQMVFGYAEAQLAGECDALQRSVDELRAALVKKEKELALKRSLMGIFKETRSHTMDLLNGQ